MKIDIREWMADLARSALDNSVISRAIEVIDSRSYNRMSELGMICQAFEFISINSVKGDYFEFGLWRGKTFRYAHRMKHRFRKHDMLLWGFDSFQGLPAITDHRDSIWSEGDFACSEPQLRRILRRSGMRNDEYELVPGFYRDSLNDALHQRLFGRDAAIVYIDCDLYESTSYVLEFIRQYLVNGSIVCFDDFYTCKGAPNQGEQRSLMEFLDAHTDVRFIPYFDYSPVGKSFIVRRVSSEQHMRWSIGE